MATAPSPRRPDVTTSELVGGIEQRELVLVDYDTAWPEVYARHESRIRTALGQAVRIEHIGSTSVPGLAAKPIIDILVVVEDITAEEDYLDQLLGAGYRLRVREPGHRMLRTSALDVHVHVLQVGDQAGDDYLLFRDRLRADVADRELYGRTKRALIDQGWTDMNAYSAAKNDVIAEIKERARASHEPPVPAAGEFSDDLALAFSVVNEAADLALDYFESGVTPTLKVDGTPVTEADRAVEALLRERLSCARPDDALLGEEFGRLGASERVWTLDPIDGTRFFAQGDPNWRIQIALQVAGTLRLSVVVAPALSRCWWAVRGGGAFESCWPREESGTRRLTVSTTEVLEAGVLEAVDNDPSARGPLGAWQAPTSPLPLIGLARGEVDAFLVERYHLWDHAPWILIVQEAGGCFTDPTGGSAGDRGGGLYSNHALHDRLLAALRYPAL